MTLQQYVQILLSPHNRIGVSKSYINIFCTAYRFDQSFENYWLANKNKWGSSSVAKFAGAHIMDFLFWDIDKEDENKQADIAGATIWLLELLEHAEKTWAVKPEDFRIWLTAGKGYHPYLPSGLFQPWPHDMNAAAAVHFTESFFPAGWVGKYKKLDGALTGAKIDPVTFRDPNRLNRQGGSQNLKEGREWNGYKVGATPEMIQALAKNYKLYYEFANEPTLLYLSEDYLDGSAYWQIEPNPKLVQLWKESVERAVIEKEGKRLTPQKTANGQPIPQSGASFFIPENLEVPQCVRNMHKQLQAGEIKGGFRHGAFMVIASFYSRLLPQTAVLAMLLALNANLANSKSPDEIEKIVNDVYERGYRTGCGNPNSDLGQTCLAFCNQAASVDECPKHKSQEGGLIAQRSTGINTAYQKMIVRAKQGVSPIKLGVEEWDLAVGRGHRLGEMLTYVGFPESAKTATVTRVTQDLCSAVKSMNGLVLLFTPEHDNETVAELLVQQRGKMCGKEIYEHANNGGFSPTLNQWFQDMEETLITVNSVFFTIQDVKRTLEFWEKKLSKKVLCVILDGVIFFSPGELGRTRRPDEEVAKYLKGLAVSWPFFGVYNLHVEKAGGAESDKDKKPSEQKLKGNAGFGTGHYYNASEFYVPLTRRDGDVVWNIKKFRSGYEGKEPPKEIIFKFHRPHYFPYTTDEATQFIRQYGLDFFNGDPKFLLPPNFKLDRNA